MKATFYKTNDDKRVLNKNLISVYQKVIHIKKPCDALNPTILINLGVDNINDFNYVFIEKLNRFYFTEPPTLLNDGLAEVRCNADVLMSYSADISNLQILVDRQENVNSPYIIDNELPTFTNRIVSKHLVGSVPTSKGNNVVLTVTGG